MLLEGESMKTILIVEDDTNLRTGLQYDFEAEGYQVITAEGASEAIACMNRIKLNIAILDVNLSDANGFFLCNLIKQQMGIPVIFLTACDLEEDQIKGFEQGADDYVTKPFSMIVLRKRVEAVLRRHNNNTCDMSYQDGYLEINFEQLTAQKSGQEMVFTPTEWKLLKMLIQNVGNIVTRTLLLEKLWDNEGNFVDEHALTVNINRLRGKLEEDGGHKYIKTVYGMGYLWVGGKIE